MKLSTDRGSAWHVDALSRVPAVAAVTEDEADMYLQVAQSRDPVVQSLVARLKNGSVKDYALKDGLLCRVLPPNRRVWYMPREM